MHTDYRITLILVACPTMSCSGVPTVEQINGKAKGVHVEMVQFRHFD